MSGITAATLALFLAASAPALAGTVTYDISVAFPADASGGPWAGQTLTGYASYDDTTGRVINGFGTYYPITDGELTLPSGTVVDETGLRSFGVGFVVPNVPHMGFEVFFDSSMRNPDPLDPAIRWLAFDVVNTHGAGFRYFDDINSGGGPYVNGYYGYVTYTLRVDPLTLIEALYIALGEISTDPADGQMGGNQARANENHIRSLQRKLESIAALVVAGDTAAALTELAEFRQKADCGSPNWFVCGSAAQTLVADSVDEIVASLLKN
ncbi:MAG TPA: hypothetical protein VNA24_13275 [Hyalangium sp.]|nr:hypothetical protein [Hyalangium sp.]